MQATDYHGRFTNPPQIRPIFQMELTAYSLEGRIFNQVVSIQQNLQENRPSVRINALH
jgi:hypothetical protein